MNETIGAKGGKNDRRRTLIITKNQYQKLLEHKKDLDRKELEKLEKKLKINQLKTAAFAIPLVLAGTIIKELVTPPKKNLSQEEKNPKKENTLDETIKEKTNADEKERQIETTNQVLLTSPKPLHKSKPVEIIDQNYIPLPSVNIESATEKKLENLKNHEIIARYESKLKEIKLELKKLIFEYNIIVSEYDDIYDSKSAEELLDKLNLVIKKIESLKKMIDVPNLEDYDQNYIYTIITEYLEDFAKAKVAADIKDSDLYISISSKLQELDEKKDRLNENLQSKKEKLSLDEEHLEELKNQYDSFDNFNISLLKFQADQDVLTHTLEKNVANAVSESEKVETQLRFFANSAQAVRDLITPQLLIPGPKSAIRVAAAAASLIHIMRNHIRPRIETKRYIVISVNDYSKEILNTIKDIDKGLELLAKSKRQLINTLAEFKEKYKNYFGQVKECDKLLGDLESIIDSLEEKEDELKRIKQEQEKNLAKNKEKVKMLTRN